MATLRKYAARRAVSLVASEMGVFMLRSFSVLLAACSVHAPSRANAGVKPDTRVREAMEIVINRPGQNGRWPLNLLHCERIPLEMESAVGSASRWNTLPTFRVLR
ncbi:MAG: hypothetical protein JO249_06040 [Acidobacteria bacterium]|nr:hypothetical protein [Acidobacteriota bacterium]